MGSSKTADGFDGTEPVQEVAVLKPCPFCGEPHAVVTQKLIGKPDGPKVGGDWQVICGVAVCYLSAGPYRKTKAEAITAWNTRASGWRPIEKEGVASPRSEAPAETVYTRAELEEMSVIQMAAGIDIEMGPIPERAADPMCAKAVERRALCRRLARAAFQLIPNFALNMEQIVAEEQTPTPDPGVMRDYIDQLTRFYIDNPAWVALAEEARGYIGALQQAPPHSGEATQDPPLHISDFLGG